MAIERSIFRVGSKVWFQEGNHQIVAFSATTATLKSMRSGELAVVSLAEMLTSTGFTLEPESKSEDSSPEAEGRAIPGNVPEEAMRSATALARHLLEALTGYQSGTSDDALPGEPHAQYDPARAKLTHRIIAKANDLGVKERVMWQYKSDFVKYGVLGLVDRRAIRLGIYGPSAIVSAAIEDVIREQQDKSTQTLARILWMIRAKVRENPLPDGHQMESDSTLARYLYAHPKGRPLLKSAKARRSASNRPQHAYTRFHATRQGEVVLIDSTPLDAFAIDPVTYKAIPVRLTLAIDLYTRSIVGWRFTAGEKAVDAALLLADILSPKRSREFIGDPLAKPFVGIPESIIAHIDSDEETQEHGRLIPIPFLHPESVLIDQGRVFISDAFLMAARQLGINVMLARPYTPTDKAHVERMFRTIREKFVLALPGYKGPNVEMRGHHVEDDAHYFMHEIDEAFREWIATYWQERSHDGLFLPQIPQVELSPNQMLAEGIARAGFMHVVPDPNMYYQLLPVTWKKIHHYGVDFDKLRYDSEDLDPFRGQASPYETARRLWPFRYDPRDKSKLYFWDDDTKRWQEVFWTGMQAKNRPFDDKVLQFAKKVVFERTLEAPTRPNLEVVLNELLDKISNPSTQSRAERRVFAQMIIKQQKAEEDRRRHAKQPGNETQVEPVDEDGDGDLPQTVSTESDDHCGGPPARIDDQASLLEDDEDNEGRVRRPPTASVSIEIKPIDEAIEDDADGLVY